MDYTAFLSMLQGVKGNGTQHYARCPAHEDKKQSLSVGQGQDGRILLKCQAGCSNDLILSALGISSKDLFSNAAASEKQAATRANTVKPVAIYDYTDASGRLLARKTRWPGKGFSWSHPNGKGGWDKGRGDAPKVLYNLPAVAVSDVVWIVEGEKDADTLKSQGKASTCNPDGAGPGKWLPEFTEALRDKTCYVVPDHDEQGWEHAENIARSLHGVATAVKVLNLAQVWPEIPEKGDTTDYINYYAETFGETGAETALLALDVMADGAPEWEQKEPLRPARSPKPTGKHTLLSLDQVTPTPPRYFWDPYIRLHNINIVRGDGGVGKTMFIMALASAVTNGTMPDGMPGVLNAGQGAVIYYGMEDDPSEYAHRAMLCGCDRRHLYVIGEGSTLPSLADLNVFRDQIKQTGAKMIVLDPLQSFLGAGSDMNKANDVRPMLDGLRAVCQELECTAVIVEHLNKATQQKAHYRGIGSVDIINGSRSALMIGWHPQQQGVRVAVQIKENAKHGQPVAFTIDDHGKFAWQGICDVIEEEVANARRFNSTAAAGVVFDPVLALVMALLDKHPDGWKGTSDQMLAEGSALVDCSSISDPRSVGRRLPGIHHEIAKRGFSWTKNRRTHYFSRKPQLTLLKPEDED